MNEHSRAGPATPSACLLPEPRFATIGTWLALTGMTRTGTYAALARGELRAIKQPGGRRTLIDVEHGLAWLRAQPAVTIRAKQTNAI